MTGGRVPRWLRILAFLVRHGHRDLFVGDLLEEYERFVLPARGSVRARLWLVGMAAAGAAQALFYRVRISPREGRTERSRGGGLGSLTQDLRYALRYLSRSPVFSLVAAASLAIGIGANTAIFSVVNAILLQRPGFSEPERLVEVYTTDPSGLIGQSVTAWATLPDLQALEHVFEGVVGFELFFGSTSIDDDTRPVLGEIVSGNYFDVLGVSVEHGRSFTPGEDQVPGQSPVVVLSHAYWTDRFGADRDVLGRQIRINGKAFTVIGVAAAGYDGAFPGLASELFAPRMMLPDLAMLGSGRGRLQDRSRRAMFVKARLGAGIGVEGAGAALDGLALQLELEHPEAYDGQGFEAVPTEEVSLHPMLDRALVPVAGLLMGVVGLVLIMACANLAGFLLARGADRRKEIAVRLALGASRVRLLRQLLTETVVLSLLGGGAGVGLAFAVAAAIRNFRPPALIPLSLDITVDRTVLLFALVVSALTGLLFGLLPSLQATRPDLTPSLKGERDGPIGRGAGGRLRGGLLVAQVATSLVLLVVGSLFLRSLLATQQVDPGFRVANGAIATLEFASSGYSAEEALVALDDLEEQLGSSRIVAATAFATRLPLAASVQVTGVQVPGHAAPDDEGLATDLFTVSSGYFETMRVPVLSGREFTDADGPEAQPVAVVSESFARRYWPGRSPLGLTFAQDHETVTVIGVARDVKVQSLREVSRPHIYRPIRQAYLPIVSVVAGGTVSDAELAGVLRRTLTDFDPDLLVLNVTGLEEHFDFALLAPRMAVGLLGAAGVITLLLASVGLFGIVSYTVARRTREVGIRISLGADLRSVRTLLVKHGLKLTALGVAIGVVLALGAGQIVSSFLFGVNAADPVSFVGAPLLLFVISACAAYIPARRASRIDPTAALRSD